MPQQELRDDLFMLKCERICQGSSARVVKVTGFPPAFTNTTSRPPHSCHHRCLARLRRSTALVQEIPLRVSGTRPARPPDASGESQSTFARDSASDALRECGIFSARPAPGKSPQIGGALVMPNIGFLVCQQHPHWETCGIMTSTSFEGGLKLVDCAARLPFLTKNFAAF